MILQRLRNRGSQAANLAPRQEELARLRAENRADRDRERERRIVELRHLAGIGLLRGANGGGTFPRPAAELRPATDSGLPEYAPAELTPELVRGAILRDGCVLVHGLVPRAEAERLADEIDKVFAARSEHGQEGDVGGYYREFVPQPPYAVGERDFVDEAGDVFTADSPRVMFDVLEAFAAAGLDQLVRGYLGEPPALSANKSLLRRVEPGRGSAWHQDGAFMGDVRALNVWLSLSRCGDRSPGLDIVPRRIEEIVPTGTEGAIFDWSVAPELAQRAAGDAGIARPIFDPGDALLFDDRLLHATAMDPAMTETRYAVESWFFAPSAFPGDYAPIAF